MRSRNLKIRNLPKGDKRLAYINSKPYVFLWLFLFLALMMLVSNYRLLALIFLFLFIYNFCFVRNTILVEFYKDYVIFYDFDKKDECYLLFWDDVMKWEYVHTRSEYDALQIVLKNNQKVCIRCLSKHKILRYFKRCVGSMSKEYNASRKSIL